MLLNLLKGSEFLILTKTPLESSSDCMGNIAIRWLQRHDAVNQSLTIFLALPVALYLAMDSATSQQTAEALRYLQVKVPPLLHQPVIGIICGSGLKGLADVVLPEPRFEIPYADIPHFPQSTGMR